MADELGSSEQSRLSKVLVSKKVACACSPFFGAQIGKGVIIRDRVRIHWPWKLDIGDHSWIGEGVWLLNLEQISIGKSVCVSQEAMICTGSHDLKDFSFKFDNGMIRIEESAWVCARSIILRGSVVPAGNVVPAGSVFKG